MPQIELFDKEGRRIVRVGGISFIPPQPGWNTAGISEGRRTIIYRNRDGSKTIESEDGQQRVSVKAKKMKRQKKPRKRK